MDTADKIFFMFFGFMIGTALGLGIGNNAFNRLQDSYMQRSIEESKQPIIMGSGFAEQLFNK